MMRRNFVRGILFADLSGGYWVDHSLLLTNTEYMIPGSQATMRPVRDWTRPGHCRVVIGIRGPRTGSRTAFAEPRLNVLIFTITFKHEIVNIVSFQHKIIN